VVTDILGKSGRDILAALLEGTMDPAAMAALARGRMRRKRAALEQALEGRRGAHHRMLIALHLEHVDMLDEQIERLSAEFVERLRPFEAELARLETIPGVGRRTAEILAAESGLEMGRFASAGHLASWAGMCPGVHERAGKRKGGKRRAGNKAVRRALMEAAQAAARTKKPGRTYLRGQYRRLVVRCGKKKAAVAGGHTILRIAYRLLKDQETYQEGVLVHLDEHRRARAAARARPTQGLGLRCHHHTESARSLMNYDVLVELGLAPSLITALHVSQWGSEVAIACLYDPDNARTTPVAPIVLCSTRATTSTGRWSIPMPCVTRRPTSSISRLA